MKEYILLINPHTPACENLLKHPDMQRVKSQFKILHVDDEQTREMLLDAEIDTLPRLFVQVENGYLKIHGLTDILSFVSDTFKPMPVVYENVYKNAYERGVHEFPLSAKFEPTSNREDKFDLVARSNQIPIDNVEAEGLG